MSRPSVNRGDKVVVEETVLSDDRCAKVGETYEVIEYDDDMDIVVRVGSHKCSVTSWRLAEAEPEKPKVGETWLAPIQGKVTAVTAGRVLLRSEDGSEFSFKPEFVTEKVADAEPEWLPGDVIRSPLGYVYFRTERDWVSVDSHGRFSDDSVSANGKNVLLVRGGQPVAA